jgi:hypothetical protein
VVLPQSGRRRQAPSRSIYHKVFRVRTSAPCQGSILKLLSVLLQRFPHGYSELTSFMKSISCQVLLKFAESLAVHYESCIQQINLTVIRLDSMSKLLRKEVQEKRKVIRQFELNIAYFVIILFKLTSDFSNVLHIWPLFAE